MKVTECDLSYDIAKLDITALEEALNYSLFSIASAIGSEAREITNGLTTKDREDAIFSTACTKGIRITSYAKQLTKVAELLYTVQESHNREIKCVDLLKE